MIAGVHTQGRSQVQIAQGSHMQALCTLLLLLRFQPPQGGHGGRLYCLGAYH